MQKEMSVIRRTLAEVIPTGTGETKRFLQFLDWFGKEIVQNLDAIENIALCARHQKVLVWF